MSTDSINETKTCNKCHIEKYLTDYYKDYKCKQGVKPSCKICTEKIKIIYNQENRDKLNEKRRFNYKKKSHNKIDSSQKKTCNKCKNNKYITEFYKNASGKFGVKQTCKECIQMENKFRKKKEKKEMKEDNKKEYKSQKKDYNKKEKVKEAKKNNKKIIQKNKIQEKKEKKSNDKKADKAIIKSSFLNYNDLVIIFDSENCILLTTEIQYNNITAHTYYLHCTLEYTATCGHMSSIVLSNFKKKYGLLCKSCTIDNVKSMSKNRHQEFINTNDDNNEYLSLEYNGYLFLKDILIDDFSVRKTFEGCISDFVIKPVNNLDNKWLKIQLKTTNNIIHGLYSFHLKQKYFDCIVICICQDDDKFWIFDYNAISHHKNKLYRTNKI